MCRRGQYSLRKRSSEEPDTRCVLGATGRQDCVPAGKRELEGGVLSCSPTMEGEPEMKGRAYCKSGQSCP